MKNLKHALFFAALLLFVSCSKDVNVKLSENTHNFEAGGGSAEIALESNGNWQVNGCPEWLTIAPMSGEGNATLALTCEGNISGQERSAEIKVKTKNNEATLAVKQAFVEGNFIVFTPANVNSDFLGGDFSVRVDANCDWSIGTLPAWIHCEPMSGSQSANIVVTIDRYAFSSEGNREYDIDFASGTDHFYLHVKQENDQAYHVVPTPSSLNVGIEGTTQTVALQSITSWTLECAADWVSVTPTSGDGNGEITVTVAPNTSYSTRNARIVLTSSVGCTNNIMIYQEASINPHYLEVNPSSLTFPGEESTREFTISTDSTWNIICHDSWLALSQASGTGNATISVTAEAYTLLGSRRAELEVISGSIAHTVAISQVGSATEPALSFSTNLIQIDSEHAILPVSISSNVQWTLRMSEEWIVSDMMQGIGDTDINLEVKDNTSQEPRSVMVYLCYHNVPYDTLTIEQAGRVYHIEANVTELNASKEGDTFVVNVTANQGWGLTSNANWVHFDPGHGSGDESFRITVDANNTPATRNAEIRLSGEVSGMVTIIVHQSN